MIKKVIILGKIMWRWSWKEVKHIHVSAADLESNRKPWLVQIPEAATGGVPQKKGVL